MVETVDKSTEALETPHRESHETIKRVVEYKCSGNGPAAEAEYKKIGLLSEQIIGLITELQNKVRD